MIREPINITSIYCGVDSDDALLYILNYICLFINVFLFQNNELQMHHFDHINNSGNIK